MFRRIASRAAAAALRPTVSTSRTNAFAPALRQSVRAFQLREKSSLVSLLKREVEEEKSNCFEGDDLEELKKKVLQVFTLTDSPNKMEVVLEGDSPAGLVRVKFDVQDVVELEEDYEDGEELEEGEPAHDHDEEGEEDVDELPGIRFVAEISKDNAGLQFECIAGTTLTVERVRFLNDIETDSTDESLYFGPNFIDLELDLQQAFYSYLAECNVDDELAQFITQYADLKEQREYLAFLQNAVKFMKK